MPQSFKFKHQKSILKNIIYLILPSKTASSGPPIGPILGQYGIPAGPFCKDFNERSKIFNDNVFVRVRISLFINNEYNFDIILPSDYYFVKIASGITKGSSRPGYLISDIIFKKIITSNKKPKQKYLTPYMIYEYTLYKKNNNIITNSDIYSSFSKTANSTKSIGVKIVTDINPIY